MSKIVRTDATIMSSSSRQSKRRRVKTPQYLHQFLRPKDVHDIAIVQLHKLISTSTSLSSASTCDRSQKEGKQIKNQSTASNNDNSKTLISNLSINNNIVNGLAEIPPVFEILSDDSKQQQPISEIFSSSFEYRFCMNELSSLEDPPGSLPQFNEVDDSSSDNEDDDDDDDEESGSDDDEEEAGQTKWIDEEFSSLINSSVLLDENQNSSPLKNTPNNNGVMQASTSSASSHCHNHQRVCDDCSTELIDETAKSVSDKEEQKSPRPFVETVTYKELLKDSAVVKSLLKNCHGVTNGFVAVGVRGVRLPSILLGIMDSGCSFYTLDYKKAVCDSYLARTVLQFNWIIADLDWVKSSDIEDEIVIAHHVFRIQNDTFFLIKLAEIPTSRVKLINYPRFKYAYAMRTTGTCGNRRIVLVPHKAISINVMDFLKRFKMSVDSNNNRCKKDVIIGLSPPTFDPYIIDLFISLGTGSKIVYVDDPIKLNPNDMLKVVQQEKITIMQCTPSYLMRFEKEQLRSSIFHGDSCLRILALGGEKCLTKSILRQLIPKEKQSKLNIFNLYGHTELSVWATIERINLSMKTDIDEVSLGSPLNHVDIAVFRLPTEFGFGNEGEVFIGSRRKRKCVVFSEKFSSIIHPVALEGRDGNYRYLQTGDYVKVQNTFINSKLSKTEIFFVNRMDRIKKRNGIKIDLGNIEKVAMETQLFSTAECFEFKQKILLLLRLDKMYPDNSAAIAEVYAKLYAHLKSVFQNFDNHPERILIVAKDTPLNENSKLDLKVFDLIDPNMAMIKSFSIDSEKFTEIFSHLWQLNTLSAKHPNDDDTFLSCGGSSVSATRLVEGFFFKIERFGSELHIENEKKLIALLLSRPLKEVKTAFYDIVKQSKYPCQFALVDGKSAESHKPDPIQYVEAPWESNEEAHSQGLKKDANSFVARMKLPPAEYHRVMISVGLCFDAIPVVAPHPAHKTICITASHSGAVYAFSMFEGLDQFRSVVGRKRKSLVWKRLFPNRIECSMTIHPTKYLGYLGCHDGKLYMISTVNGQTEWSVSCGSSIRHSPALSPKADCVVVLTSFTVICIDALHGTILWTQLETGNFIVSKSSVISETSVFYGSKGTGLTSLCIKTGTLQWSSNENMGNSSFICTAPILISANNELDKNLVVFGDTRGRIFALDQSTGDRVWKYRSSYAYKDPPSNLVYHDCCLKGGPGRVILYTTLSGFIRMLNPVTGTLITEVKTTEALRCVPEIVHVTDEPVTSNKVVCSYFFNSKRGSMFWTFFNGGQLKKPATKIYEFGTDGAESFSSPIFIPNILTVGSRDNKAYFVEFRKLDSNAQ